MVWSGVSAKLATMADSRLRATRFLAFTLLWTFSCSDPPRPPEDAGSDADVEPDADVESDADADADADEGGPTTCSATREDFPEPQEGHCHAVILDERATLTVGPDGEGGHIIPGGQRLSPVGDILELGGFPMRALEVPGTSLLLVTDGGRDDEILSVIDTNGPTVLHEEFFARHSDEALFLGLVLSADGRRLWASGGGSNIVLSYDLDHDSGALTPRPDDHILAATEVADGYVSGLALSPSGILAINLLLGDQLLLWDTTRGEEVGRVAFDLSSRPYDVVLSPDGSTAWISLWADAAVAVVDVNEAELLDVIAVGKNPEGLTLSPDATRLIVSNSDSDSLSVIDTTLAEVVNTHWIVAEDALRGASPSAVRYGPAGRLFVVNAFENAVDVLQDDGSDGFLRLGRIPTMWHPTDVTPLANGDVAILTGRHVGTGPNVDPLATDIMDLVGGSVAIVRNEEITDDALVDWELEVTTNNEWMMGFNGVECPADAEDDFPIPQPGAGPSPVIDRVVLIVRENKTYDAYFGNLTDADGEPMGRGDPSLTLFVHEEIEQIIPNTLALARIFASGDNYYSHAEQSLQGHIWTVMGRTTDFVERVWLTTGGRSFWGIPPMGILPVGYPEEGSAFDYFLRNGLTTTDYGEIVGSATVGLDPGFPGLAYSYVPDIEKAEYVESRIIERCRLNNFTYVQLPNDHTQGLRPGAETPRSMIADNDEGVARVVQAISHSTFWPSTVIFIIEDDPQTGGDHIDNHRSPLLVVSPWARRGYVSSVHYDEPSIYRTIQLIFGLEQPNSAIWARAAPMYDLFTSTPDYTPYEVVVRRWPQELNPDDDSAMARQSEAYDWSEPDEQPGLPQMLWRHLRGTEPTWRVIEEPFEEED